MSNLLPAPGVCGTDNTNRIIGGEITKIDEFPWMALIEYSKRKFFFLWLGTGQLDLEPEFR